MFLLSTLLFCNSLNLKVRILFLQEGAALYSSDPDEQWRRGFLGDFPPVWLASTDEVGSPIVPSCSLGSGFVAWRVIFRSALGTLVLADLLSYR
jgi:hypothetical protein